MHLRFIANHFLFMGQLQGLTNLLAAVATDDPLSLLFMYCGVKIIKIYFI